VAPDHEWKPAFTERLNAPVQGTAADILKLALARLWEGRSEHPGTFPILTVHDEIVIECDEKAAQDTARWLSGILRDAVADVLVHPELASEDVVEISVCNSWGEV
jgi:DNA polymerase I